MGTAATTPEKYTRALVGELPHAACHVMFAFFYGGGLFIVVAIFVSMVKILYMPLVREVLKSQIPQLGCSELALSRYMSYGGRLNWGDNSVKSAKKYCWNDVLTRIRSVIPDFDDLGDIDDSELLAHARSLGDTSVYLRVLEVLHNDLGTTNERQTFQLIYAVCLGELSVDFLNILEAVVKLGGSKRVGAFTAQCLLELEVSDDTAAAVRRAVAQVEDKTVEDASADASKVDEGTDKGLGQRAIVIRSAEDKAQQRALIGLYVLAIGIPALALGFGQLAQK